MAARMPMMRITTRSSMSVKPFSSLLIRSRSFRSMCLLLEGDVGWVWVACIPRTCGLPACPLHRPPHHPSVGRALSAGRRPRVRTTKGGPEGPPFWHCWGVFRLPAVGAVRVAAATLARRIAGAVDLRRGRHVLIQGEVVAGLRVRHDRVAVVVGAGDLH